MPVWLLIALNLFFWLALAQALISGRVVATIILFRVTFADRRDNPVFYWLYTGVLAAACVMGGLRLAEAILPGFHPPVFPG